MRAMSQVPSCGSFLCAVRCFFSSSNLLRWILTLPESDSPRGAEREKSGEGVGSIAAEERDADSLTAMGPITPSS
jgi:hypothetical protein